MPDNKAIGERLQKLRGGKSRKEVAEALGVSKMAISLWERGLRVPGDEMKVKIATYYKRSVASIFFKL